MLGVALSGQVESVVNPATRMIVPLWDTLIAALTCTCTKRGSSTDYRSDVLQHTKHIVADNTGSKTDASTGNRALDRVGIVRVVRIYLFIPLTNDFRNNQPRAMISRLNTWPVCQEVFVDEDWVDRV